MLKSKRKNNFDLLRIILAAWVMMSHLEVILPANYGFLRIFSDIDNTRAVQGFFVISGFLIVRSYRQSHNLEDYTSKRARRIYPGLFIVVIACVILGAFVTTLDLNQYFGTQTARYMIFNLLFMTFTAPNLPGVFTHNFDTFVNGPLWTLKIEVMFYALVPLLFLTARVIRFERLLVALYVASVAWAAVMGHIAASHGGGFAARLERQLPGQLSYFMAGAMLERYLPWFKSHAVAMVIGAVTVLIAGVCINLFPLYPAALAVVIVYIATAFPVTIAAARFGDFSYGLYIGHFPIIQTFAALEILEGSPGLRAVAAIGASFAYAVLSWRLVERPFLVAAPRGAVRAKDAPA